MLAAGDEAMVEAGFRTGDFASAEVMLRSVHERAVADGDRAVEAAALDRLGMLTHFRALDSGIADADADGEEALFQQALAIRREIGDPAGTAQSLFGVGLVHQVLRRDWTAAMPYYREALALAEKHGDELTRSEVHRHVGFYYLAVEQQPEQALHHLRISQDLRERVGDPRWLPGGHVALSMAERAGGRPAEQLRHLREAVRIARAIGLLPSRIERFEQLLNEAEAQQADTAG